MVFPKSSIITSTPLTPLLTSATLSSSYRKLQKGTMLKVVVFTGSARKGNYTQHVGDFVTQVLSEDPDFSVEQVNHDRYDLDFNNEGQGASPDELTKLVTEADAYVIVSPEYNHGYPGSLKYLLDLNLKEYIHKPVALVGVSSGPWGGVRVIEQLVQVVRELGMAVTFTDTQVTNVKNEIKDGKFTDPDKWRKRIERSIQELKWMAQTLKYGRENIPSEYH